VFWNLQQLAGALSLAAETEALVEALNGFGAAYRAELTSAMLARLGVLPGGGEDDAALVQAAFRGIAEGGERLRWEPFFFDWFCGDEARALAGPRGDLYGGEEFAEFRRRLSAAAPDRPERLADPYFAAPEPEELLVDEIEALWEPIAEADDWSAFQVKLAGIERARQAWGLPAQGAQT
jgi:serine/tyrosine/threonine adenylyltransferase